MNRTVLAGIGILGGILLAILFIWAAGPTGRLPDEPQIPAEPQVAPRANSMPTSPPAKTGLRKESLKVKNDSMKVNKRPIPTGRPHPRLPPQSMADATIQDHSSRKVHLAVQAHARWGQVLGVISRDKDPVTEGLKQRIQDMRMEMVAARREPESLDMNEIEQRQRLILSELRQIPSWGPELEKTARRVETLLNAIGEQ